MFTINWKNVKENQVTSGIFHGIPWESIVELIYPMPLIELSLLFDVWFRPGIQN